ncbi:MAG TPA: hypothetical protein GXX15_12280 [Clostridia bacterium]|nr:hypothetical protein [Clostridia bacterium]
MAFLLEEADNKEIEKVIGLQSFSIFMFLMISGILNPSLRIVIPLAIDLVSSIRGTIALLQKYTKADNEENNKGIFPVLLAYYVVLILLYSAIPYYRGGFDVASDILPLPSDAESMFYPFKYPQP